jgi:Tfp pilus assembly protein PilN
MKKLLFAITLLTATGSVAVCVGIQRHTAAALRERAESADAQTQTIVDLDAQNTHLSQIVDKLKSTRKLSHDEMTELLKLRSNIGQARQLVAAKPALEAANTRLREIETNRLEHLAQAQAATNYWPKNQLSFAGFATPDDTVRTILWTMATSNVNLNAFKSYCTPQSVADMQREWKERGLSPDKQQAELNALADGYMSPSEGFHIVKERFPSPDKADVDVSFDGEDVVRCFMLQKIDGQWKFDDVRVPGHTGR